MLNILKIQYCVKDFFKKQEKFKGKLFWHCMGNQEDWDWTMTEF